MAGDFDASEPTMAELRAEAWEVLERVVTLLAFGTFPATPRARKLLYDATNHLHNALSALEAIEPPFEQVRIWQETNAPYILWENVCGALSSNTGEVENPYDAPGPIPPFHKSFRRTEPDGTPASDIAQER